MLKKRDIIIFSLIAVVVGFFVMRQYYAGVEARKLVQPENNQVLALEVAHLTKSTAELRSEITALEDQRTQYQKSLVDRSSGIDSIDKDLKRYQEINGFLPINGRGLILKINKELSQPQVVDLANTIRNVGVNGYAINNQRVGLNYHFISVASGTEFKIIGNPTLVRSALTRKGGYLDQLFSGANEYSISESDNISLNTIPPIQFIFGGMVN